MLELFLKVRSALEASEMVRGARLDSQVEQNAEWLRDQISELLQSEQDLRIQLEDLPTDYILTFSPETVREHVCIHRDSYRLLRQKSLMKVREHEDCWSVLVMSTDRPGLLAKICGILTLHNLNVVRAQIFTWNDGTVVDILDVRPTDGLQFHEKEWGAVNSDLDLALAHRLGLSHRLYHKLASFVGRRAELLGKVEQNVMIDNESSDIYSVVEVHAADQPGLLYHITQTLADFGLNIHKAFIATEVERLIDVFYVLDSKGRKIVDNDFREEITHGLLYAMDRSER